MEERKSNQKFIYDFWLFRKYEEIKITNMGIRALRELIVENTGIKLNKDESINTNFEWNSQDSYVFFYDYEGNTDIRHLLLCSSLISSKSLFVEMPTGIPIVEIDTLKFIENWEDFINANCQMGCIIVSTDFKYILEFTDDHDYKLYSNFLIKCPPTSADLQPTEGSSA